MIQVQENQAVCPSCGYCPHCGRGGHQFYPYYPQPIYPYPWYYNSQTGAYPAINSEGSASSSPKITYTSVY